VCLYSIDEWSVVCECMYVCGCSKSGRDAVNGQCDKEEAAATTTTPRSKCWPPSYCDPPPLIITDYGVCRATTPAKHPGDPQPPGTEHPGEDPGEARNPLVTVTVTMASDDDDLDDSHRLLASSPSSSSSSQHVDTVPTVPPPETTDDTVPPLCNAARDPEIIAV